MIMHRSTVPMLVSLGFAAACSNSTAPTADNPAVTAAQGLDAVQGVNDEAAMLELTIDGSDSATAAAGAALLLASPTPESVAAYMATHVGAALQPPTCHSATTNGATDVFTFNDCTGPRGLSHTTGTMTVTYSVDVQGIHSHSTATDFVVNQSTLSIDATTTYVSSGGTRSISVTSTSSGTGPLGNSILRQGSYTSTWTSTCHTLNGTWSSTVAGLTASTTETNVTRCSGACPQAGGTVSETKRNGVTVTITYDGTATAHWTNGTKSGTIQLLCTPA